MRKKSAKHDQWIKSGRRTAQFSHDLTYALGKTNQKHFTALMLIKKIALQPRKLKRPPLFFKSKQQNKTKLTASMFCRGKQNSVNRVVFYLCLIRMYSFLWHSATLWFLEFNGSIDSVSLNPTQPNSGLKLNWHLRLKVTVFLWFYQIFFFLYIRSILIEFLCCTLCVEIVLCCQPQSVKIT